MSWGLPVPEAKSSSRQTHTSSCALGALACVIKFQTESQAKKTSGPTVFAAYPRKGPALKARLNGVLAGSVLIFQQIHTLDEIAVYDES